MGCHNHKKRGRIKREPVHPTVEGCGAIARIGIAQVNCFAEEMYALLKSKGYKPKAIKKIKEIKYDGDVVKQTALNMLEVLKGISQVEAEITRAIS